MRETIIAGNWKMNMDLGESRDLVNGILKGIGSLPNTPPSIVICPPFTSLHIASELIRGSRLHLGAQNMSQLDSGAFTGEISAKMLISLGCSYVIVGHSERRQFYGETDALVSEKARKALEWNLIPIVCVGESLAEREQGRTNQVIEGQVRKGLSQLGAEQARGIVIAYEPVWAIGTGKTATPAQAQEVHQMIRGLLADLFDERTAAQIPLQYGGSVKPENSRELLSQKDIDGALVGGACLNAESFLSIAKDGTV